LVRAQDVAAVEPGAAEKGLRQQGGDRLQGLP
jgi:hypothetical protein